MAGSPAWGQAVTGALVSSITKVKVEEEQDVLHFTQRRLTVTTPLAYNDASLGAPRQK